MKHHLSVDIASLSAGEASAGCTRSGMLLKKRKAGGNCPTFLTDFLIYLDWGSLWIPLLSLFHVILILVTNSWHIHYIYRLHAWAYVCWRPCFNQYVTHRKCIAIGSPWAIKCSHPQSSRSTDEFHMVHKQCYSEKQNLYYDSIFKQTCSIQ